MRSGEQTKLNIVDTAIRLFSERGFSNTSINDIIVESGVSKGGFYNHFKSKHALFLEIQTEWLKTFEQMFVSVFTSDPEMIYNFERALFEIKRMAEEERYKFDLMFEFMVYSRSDEEARTIAQEFLEMFQHRLEYTLREIYKDANLQDFDYKSNAQALLALFVGVFVEIVVFPRNHTLFEDVATTMSNLSTFISNNLQLSRKQNT